MSDRCDQCRKSIAGEPVRTATRLLCAECGAQWMGAAAAMVGGGTIGEAIATEGWFQRLRKKRRE